MSIQFFFLNRSRQILPNLDNIAGHVSIVDTATKTILYMNNKMKKDFGGDHQGKACWPIFRGSPFPCEHCAIPRLLSGDNGYTEAEEWEGFNPLTKRWYINFDQIILWTDNRPAKLQIAFDITRFKEAKGARLEHETVQYQSKKQEALARMAEAMAHHLDNQLSVVISGLELALNSDSGISFFSRKQLCNAMRAAKKSADIMGLLLQYLGLDVGVHVPLDLAEACRRSLPNLEKLLPATLKLETNLRAHGLIVTANPDLLDQIVIRLVTNAVEAMGEKSGRICLSVAAVAATDISWGNLEPKGWRPNGSTACCLKVSDTGCGIPPDHLHKIFDPFFSTKFTGRGLGLSVVLGLVMAWGGAVQVESGGEGCTFRILFSLRTGGEHKHNRDGR